MDRPLYESQRKTLRAHRYHPRLSRIATDDEIARALKPANLCEMLSPAEMFAMGLGLMTVRNNERTPKEMVRDLRNAMYRPQGRRDEAGEEEAGTDLGPASDLTHDRALSTGTAASGSDPQDPLEILGPAGNGYVGGPTEDAIDEAASFGFPDDSGGRRAHCSRCGEPTSHSVRPWGLECRRCGMHRRAIQEDQK